MRTHLPVLCLIGRMAPPQEFSWQAQEWGACSAPCGGGQKRREVLCQTRNGTVDITGQKCATLSKDYIPTTTACNALACDFCAGQGCSGHGTCNSASQKCECTMGYTGTFCAVSPVCPPGMVDGAGECCTSGVVSALGQCCTGEVGNGAAPALDGNGRCCASGQVDACGVCGGNGKVVDAVRL